jgi:hypothetical protein
MRSARPIDTTTLPPRGHWSKSLGAPAPSSPARGQWNTYPAGRHRGSSAAHAGDREIRHARVDAAIGSFAFAVDEPIVYHDDLLHLDGRWRRRRF